MSEFDVGREDWTQYAEHLAHFFTANQIIDQDRMKVLLLAMIGPTAFKLLRNTISPEKPEDKTFEQLVEAMKCHHNPTPSEIVQRYRFNSRFRKEGETIARYLAELRALAEFCNYGASGHVARSTGVRNRRSSCPKTSLSRRASDIQESGRYRPCNGNGSQEC